jgi:hypothetical protein
MGLPSVRDLHSPRIPRLRSSRISSAMLVFESQPTGCRESSRRAADGRREQHRHPLVLDCRTVRSSGRRNGAGIRFVAK